MIENRDKIMDFVRSNGPVLPVQISRELKIDTFFSGAMLSELVANKLVKISSAKIGGSPVYYINGQESKLEILYKSLPEKEKEAYNLLKTNKILKDSELEPSIKVALRSIKDFSIPVMADVGKGVEQFWKWHLTSNEEADSILRSKYLGKEELKTHVEIKKEDVKQQEISPLQVKLAEEKPKAARKRTLTDEFLEEVENYLRKNNIMIVNKLDVKKNKESEMIVSFNSELGKLTYLLLAKNKKKVSEIDLSLALNQGNIKKLPVLFLSKGELAKKARESLNSTYKGILFRKI